MESIDQSIVKRLQNDFLQKEKILTPKPITIQKLKEPFLRPYSHESKKKTKKVKKVKKVKKSKKKTKKVINLYKTPSPKLVHIHLKKNKSI